MTKLKLSTGVRAAIRHWPGSLNKLATDAGVPQTNLWMVQEGQREATENEARRLQYALERWAASCKRGADAIRRAL